MDMVPAIIMVFVYVWCLTIWVWFQHCDVLLPVVADHMDMVPAIIVMFINVWWLTVLIWLQHLL